MEKQYTFEVKQTNKARGVVFAGSKEEAKEKIDPLELQIQSRTIFLEKFRKELNFEKMICQMEGTDINPFINEIEKVIQEFKGSER